MKKILMLALMLMLVSCTDAGRSKLMSGISGASGRVVCHSGGKVIYDGCSTGKIASEHQSDGYYFRDALTDRLVEVSGECFIDYDAKCTGPGVRPSMSTTLSVAPAPPVALPQ